MESRGAMPEALERGEEGEAPSPQTDHRPYLNSKLGPTKHGEEGDLGQGGVLPVQQGRAGEQGPVRTRQVQEEWLTPG